MNLNEVRVKSKEIAKTYNISVHESLQRFMFERILERISISQYQDNFILKGGVLLSAIMGVQNRTTRDIDTTIKGIDISSNNMIKILKEILSIDLHDGVKFYINDTKDIRKTDKYGGYRYQLLGYYGEMKINLSIDISTGDAITPRELKYGYKLTFEDRIILINCYNLETILAEKFETILRRGKNNSRMKDFYDVYYFLTKLSDNIDKIILRKAIINTFKRRNSMKLLNDYLQILEDMKDTQILHLIWNRYQNKYSYAKDINFDVIILVIMEFLNDLFVKNAQ